VRKDKSVIISAISGGSVGGFGWAMSVAFTSIPPLVGYVGLVIFFLGATLYPAYLCGAKYPSVRRRLPRLLQAELPVERDVWVLDAIQRICVGRWDAPRTRNIMDVNPETGLVFARVAQEDFPQAARDGSLVVWGKEGGRMTWGEINREFWAVGRIDVVGILRANIPAGDLNGPNNPENCRTNRLESTNEQFIQLMTSRAQVDALWPPKGTNCTKYN